MRKNWEMLKCCLKCFINILNIFKWFFLLLIVLYLGGISSPLYELLYSADFGKISVEYFQCEIVKTDNVNELYSISTQISPAAGWMSCPLPSVLPSQRRKARPFNNGTVFLTLSKSTFYTLRCTPRCPSLVMALSEEIPKSLSMQKAEGYTYRNWHFTTGWLLADAWKNIPRLSVAPSYLLYNSSDVTRALIALTFVSLTGQCKSSAGLIWLRTKQIHWNSCFNIIN